MTKSMLLSLTLSLCAFATILPAESIGEMIEEGRYGYYDGVLELEGIMGERIVDDITDWEAIKQFKKLRRIDLSDNSINFLPNDFVRYVGIRGIYVDLSENFIPREQIGQIFSSAGSSWRYLFTF